MHHVARRPRRVGDQHHRSARLLEPLGQRRAGVGKLLAPIMDNAPHITQNHVIAVGDVRKAGKDLRARSWAGGNRLPPPVGQAPDYAQTAGKPFSVRHEVGSTTRRGRQGSDGKDIGTSDPAAPSVAAPDAPAYRQTLSAIAQMLRGATPNAAALNAAGKRCGPRGPPTQARDEVGCHHGTRAALDALQFARIAGLSAALHRPGGHPLAATWWCALRGRAGHPDDVCGKGDAAGPRELTRRRARAKSPLPSLMDEVQAMLTIVPRDHPTLAAEFAPAARAPARVRRAQTLRHDEPWRELARVSGAGAPSGMPGRSQARACPNFQPTPSRFQELALALHAPAIAGELLVRAHHAMAGDDDGHGVGAAGHAHRAHRLGPPAASATWA